MISNFFSLEEIEAHKVKEEVTKLTIVVLGYKVCFSVKAL